MPLARVNRAEDIPTSNPDGPWIFRGRNASSPAPGSGADPWRPKEHADFPLRDDLARPQPRGQGRARRSPVSVIRQGTRVKQPLSGQLGTDSPPEIANGNVRFAPPDYVRECPQPPHPVLASRTRSKSAFQRFAWTCPVRRGRRRREDARRRVSIDRNRTHAPAGLAVAGGKTPCTKTPVLQVHFS